MSTFIFFGKYSSEAFKGMSPKRTGEANSLLKKLGGEIVAMYALIGASDLLLIVNIPGVREALKASIALSKLTGISFTTSPAVTIEEFDKLITEI
jgi:uncharacterized protein with GYD domain